MTDLSERVVLKYKVGEVAGIPRSAHVTHVALQNGTPMVWAVVRVNDVESKVRDDLHVVGTGHPFTYGSIVGSYQEPPFVWHVLRVPQELT